VASGSMTTPKAPASAHPDLNEVIATLGNGGSLTPALNWVSGQSPPEEVFGRRAPLRAVTVPTLDLWSTGDIALTEAQMTSSADHVSGL
jgi:hypothetical protein